jgi:CBS domain-containing protein
VTENRQTRVDLYQRRAPHIGIGRPVKLLRAAAIEPFDLDQGGRPFLSYARTTSGRLAMNAADIMTHPVITVAPETTIIETARLMLQHHVSGLPVADGNAVVGMITEGDLLRRAETGTAKQHRM